MQLTVESTSPAAATFADDMKEVEKGRAEERVRRRTGLDVLSEYSVAQTKKKKLEFLRLREEEETHVCTVDLKLSKNTSVRLRERQTV